MRGPREGVTRAGVGCDVSNDTGENFTRQYCYRFDRDD